MNSFPLSWASTKSVSGIRYICGYCGADVAPSTCYEANPQGKQKAYVLICTNCNRPSFIYIEDNKIIRTTPAPRMGQDVDGLPEDLKALYDEARSSTSAGAYTAAVLTARKILMHVAVKKGAPEGKKFIEYVEYLADNAYVPPNGKEWVDYIRAKANEANHEIVIMNQHEAEDLITFIEMLLRLVYEFKHRLPNSADSTSS